MAVLFVVVLIRGLLCGSVVGPLIIGNSHLKNTVIMSRTPRDPMCRLGWGHRIYTVVNPVPHPGYASTIFDMDELLVRKPVPGTLHLYPKSPSLNRQYRPLTKQGPILQAPSKELRARTTVDDRTPAWTLDTKI